MGVCKQAGRVAIFHKNIANMITKFTGIFGEEGINITDMTNKSKGEYAYTMMDAVGAVTDELVKELESIQDVLRVRVIA
jgi:D-3-phosphoglycerate dehydrogenase